MKFFIPSLLLIFLSQLTIAQNSRADRKGAKAKPSLSRTYLDSIRNVYDLKPFVIKPLDKKLGEKLRIKFLTKEGYVLSDYYGNIKSKTPYDELQTCRRHYVGFKDGKNYVYNYDNKLLLEYESKSCSRCFDQKNGIWAHNVDPIIVSQTGFPDSLSYAVSFGFLGEKFSGKFYDSGRLVHINREFIDNPDFYFVLHNEGDDKVVSTVFGKEVFRMPLEKFKYEEIERGRYLVLADTDGKRCFVDLKTQNSTGFLNGYIMVPTCNLVEVTYKGENYTELYDHDLNLIADQKTSDCECLQDSIYLVREDEDFLVKNLITSKIHGRFNEKPEFRKLDGKVYFQTETKGLFMGIDGTMKRSKSAELEFIDAKEGEKSVPVEILERKKDSISYHAQIQTINDKEFVIAKLNTTNKYGVIKRADTTWQVEPMYDMLRFAKDDLLVADLNGETGIISYINRIVTPFECRGIQFYNGRYTYSYDSLTFSITPEGELIYDSSGRLLGEFRYELEKNGIVLDEWKQSLLKVPKNYDKYFTLSSNEMNYVFDAFGKYVFKHKWRVIPSHNVGNYDEAEIEIVKKTLHIGRIGLHYNNEVYARLADGFLYYDLE